MTNNQQRNKARLLLQQVALFSGLEEPDLDAVLDITHFRYLTAEDALFEMGQSCSAIYVADTGLIKLYLSGTGKQEKVVEFIEPGDSFAEAALFSGEGYPVSARAMQDSVVLAVDAFALTRLIRSRPHMSWNMLGVLSRRSHQLVRQLRTTSLHNAEQRVAAYLLEHYDSEQPEQPVGHLPHRRSEFACALGITPETLCRVLGKMRKNSWITTESSKIFVQDPEQLAGMITTDHQAA